MWKFSLGSILEINIQSSRMRIEMDHFKINYYFFHLYIYIYKMRSCFEKEKKNKKCCYYNELYIAI